MMVRLQQRKSDTSMFLKEKDKHDDSTNTLGGRIVHARESEELTTSQLARRLGIKSTTLQAWESDRSEPRSNRLITLAGMLNVSPTWLLTGYGERPSGEMTETEMMHIRSTIDRIREQTEAIVAELNQLNERLSSYESFQ
jgi:transcriptional regulator with XRE-family HTH domain